MSSTQPEPPRLIAGLKSDYQSFTLDNLEEAEEDELYTICLSCPAAIWHMRKVATCFCGTMKITTWPSPAPVTMCDGREIAIAKYEEGKRELARQPRT